MKQSNPPMTQEREEAMERAEFRRFMIVVTWIAIVVMLSVLSVDIAHRIYLHGYEARIKDEQHEVFKREVCIDWSHENVSNERMMKKAREND